MQSTNQKSGKSRFNDLAEIESSQNNSTPHKKFSEEKSGEQTLRINIGAINFVNNDVSQILDTHPSHVDTSKCLANELNLDFS